MPTNCQKGLNFWIPWSPISNESCTGSSVFCEYIKDVNGFWSNSLLKEAVWPTEYKFGMRKTSTLAKLARNIMANIIIVRLTYESPEVQMNKLEVRTTTTDKIANFGGTYGIWAELTGCSLLGLINLLIISFKLLFRSRN